MTAATRVVVTGLGVISPIGSDLETFWRRLTAGDSGVGEITRFDHSDHRVHIAAEVKDFDAEDYIDKRQVRRLDLFSRYAVAAGKNAAADADFDPKPEAERVGAVIGSGVGGLQTLHTEIGKLLEKGPERVNPLARADDDPQHGCGARVARARDKGPLECHLDCVRGGVRRHRLRGAHHPQR